MQEIKLWAIDKADDDQVKVTPVKSLGNTETEEELEEILANTPDLLMDGLSLIGRQVETQGGPLDLLGVDNDGHIVVLELKRGTLTRDAVAQVIDYASDIAQMTREQLAKLVEDNSGKHGIDEISDFEQWFDEHYPDQEGVDPDSTEMVLVGLGADDRARRMVEFLAASGVEIRLLTFHAFEKDGQQFIARQAETKVAPPGPTGPTKEQNLRILREEAKKLEAGTLLREVSEFLSASMPAYQYVGSTSYSYHLTETSDSGRPTQRAFVSLRLEYKKQGALSLVLYERAVKATGRSPDVLMQEFDSNVWQFTKYNEIQIELHQETWPTLKPMLSEVVDLVVCGWRERSTEAQEASEE